MPLEKNTLQDKEDIINILKSKTNHDLSDLVKNIIKTEIEKLKEMKTINEFFSQLYDELYYDIIFKNIKIDKKTFRLLESLAMPIYKKSDKEWQKILDKIKK